MRRFILFAALLTGFVSLQAQKTLLSPTAAIKALEIREGRCQADYIHAFLTLAEGTDLKALDAYGVEVNTVVGKRMTARIPVKNFLDLMASSLCSYIELSQEVQLYNDLIRDDLGIDYIHQGVNLPQGYDGTGVVVGVIDVGLFYGHPSFYDTTGTTLRIKRVWQQLDTTGNPPAGFTYGTELTTPEQMLAAVTDRVNQGHGSHVTGTAAGCGAPDGNGRRYRGMAPGADIVMVGTTLRDDGILDGIRYIHKYARSVGKPCVINMSLGSVTGPHDGTDGFSLLADDYLQGGTVDSIVVMASAGNDGTSKKHLHHHFSANDTLMNTYMQYTSQENFSMYVDCWGGVGDQFSVKVTQYNMMSGTQFDSIDETPFVPTDVDSTYAFLFNSPNDTGSYICYVSVMAASLVTGRPEIVVYVFREGAAPMRDIFALTIKSDSADVHCWSSSHDFVNYNNPQYAVGDDEYTVGGVGTNGASIISVGSYTTRNKRVNASGSVSSITSSDEGGLSFFTSRGPTWDGRVKPDICSPGEYIVSVFSTPYIPYYPANLMFDSTVFNGETYYYCLMRGTSMACPSAVGVVALWLQNTPSLNCNAVRSILHSTARHDSHTGAIDSTGDNNWGWGKINALGGLPAPSLAMHYMDVTVENINKGVVTGRGRHPEGPVTIQATPFNGYAFSAWNDGNTDNPRVVNLTSDTAFVAYFDAVDCDTITTFPWQMEFTESLLNCWDNFVRVGISPWVPVMSSMISANNTPVIDNWLVTPWLVLEDNTSLFYTIRSLNSDSLAIVAITEGGDSIVLSDEHITRTDIERHTSLAPYAGQLIRLAFHHHYTTQSSALMLTAARIDYLQGISDVAEAQRVRIYAESGRICVIGAEGREVNIYDIMGRRVRNEALPTGVYMVKVGDLPARKVVVL